MKTGSKCESLREINTSSVEREIPPREAQRWESVMESKGRRLFFRRRFDQQFHVTEKSNKIKTEKALGSGGRAC